MPGEIVFDLGAHKGDWSERMLSLYPGCIIHSFELLPLYADDIVRKFQNVDSVIVNDFGLSACAGEINIAEDGLSSSAVSHSVDSKIYLGKLESFEEYVMLNSISKIKLMKMNIEG